MANKALISLMISAAHSSGGCIGGLGKVGIALTLIFAFIFSIIDGRYEVFILVGIALSLVIITLIVDFFVKNFSKTNRTLNEIQRRMQNEWKSNYMEFLDSGYIDVYGIYYVTTRVEIDGDYVKFEYSEKNLEELDKSILDDIHLIEEKHKS